MTETFQPNVGNILWLSNQSNQKFEAPSGTSTLYSNDYQLKNPALHEISTAFTPWQSSSSPAATSSALTLGKSDATALNSWNQKSVNFHPGTMPGKTITPNIGPHFTSMATTSTISPYYASQHNQMKQSTPYSSLYNGQPQRYVYPHNTQTSFVVTNPNFTVTTTASREHGVNTAEPAFQSFDSISNVKVKSSISHASLSSNLNKARQNYIDPFSVKKVPKTSVNLFPSRNIENISHKTENSINNPSQKCSKNSTSNVKPADNPLVYPAHFMKGSIIELAHGPIKRVEDMKTEDFIECARLSADLKIDSSTVIKIVEKENTATLSFSVGEQKIQITVEAAYAHPFFVFGQGWSSCSPARTSQRYGLSCNKLAVGDVCISLTHKSDPVKQTANYVQSNSKSKHENNVKLMSERSMKSKSAPIHDQKKNNSENFHKKRRWSFT